MENLFYIISNNNTGNRYQLCVYPTHFCISAGNSLDKIAEVIKRYYKDFNDNSELVLRSLKDTSTGGKVSNATFEQRDKYYKERGKDYKNFIRQCINEVKSEKKQEFKKRLISKTPQHRKSLFKKNRTPVIMERPIEQEDRPKEIDRTPAVKLKFKK